MDAEASRFDVGRGEQICAVSCMGDGAAYCWSVLDSAFAQRDRLSRLLGEFFSCAGRTRGDRLHIGGSPDRLPLRSPTCFVEPQAVEMGGSLGTAPSLLVFEAKGLVAPSPQRSPDGVAPRDDLVSSPTIVRASRWRPSPHRLLRRLDRRSPRRRDSGARAERVGVGCDRAHVWGARPAPRRQGHDADRYGRGQPAVHDGARPSSARRGEAL